MVRQKAEKEPEVVRPPAAAGKESKSGKSSNLMAALEASLARARKEMQSSQNGSGKRRKRA